MIGMREIFFYEMIHGVFTLISVNMFIDNQGVIAFYPQRDIDEPFSE